MLNSDETGNKSLKIPNGTPNEIMDCIEKDGKEGITDEENKGWFETFCNRYLSTKEGHKERLMDEDHEQILNKPGKPTDTLQNLGHKVKKDKRNGKTILTLLAASPCKHVSNERNNWKEVSSNNMYSIFENDKDYDKNDTMEEDGIEENKMMPYSPYEESQYL